MDAGKIDITGYQPQLLGKTEAEALEGYVKRLNGLNAYALERANKLKPFAEANDRANAEPLILECATSRPGPSPTCCTRSAISSRRSNPRRHGLPGGEDHGARGPRASDPPHRPRRDQVLHLRRPAGPVCVSQFAAGEYQGFILMPRCRAQAFAVTLEADQETTRDVTLEVNHNLLRNGDLAVRWLRPEQPDGWRWYHSPEKVWHWTSEPFLVQPGRKVRVEVTWCPGRRRAGEYRLGRRQVGPGTGSSRPRATETTVTVPETERAFPATLSVRTKGDFLRTVKKRVGNVGLLSRTAEQSRQTEEFRKAVSDRALPADPAVATAKGPQTHTAAVLIVKSDSASTVEPRSNRRAR